MAMNTTEVEVDVKQIVYKTDAPSPLIAPDSEDSGYEWSPWRWDRRIWGDENYENYKTILPVLHDAETWGIPDDFWQSGVGKADGMDLRVEKSCRLRQESIGKWTFEIKPGNFFRFHDRRYLFADRSVIQQVDNSDNETHDSIANNTLQLTHVPRLGSPVWATMWTRNNVGKIDICKFVHKRVDFTGVYSSDSLQQATRDRLNDIAWDKVDRTRDEFLVDNTVDPPKLYFNKDFTFFIGEEGISNDDDLVYAEYLGEANGLPTQVFHTKYFPIIEDSNTLYLYKEPGPHETKAQATNYKIDYDRGEITFYDHADEDFTWLPAVGERLYLTYRPTLEIEYEPEDCKQKVIATEVDINPVRAGISSGFLYVSQADLDVASVFLTTDVRLFQRTRPTGMPSTDEETGGSIGAGEDGFNQIETHDQIDYGLFGPVYAGTDYCILRARAFNAQGVPVPNTEITFKITGAGFVEGQKTFSSMTNADGLATVVYSPCRSAEDLGQYCAQPATDMTLTLTDPEAVSIPSFDGDDVYTFGVYDDDVWQPWVDGAGGRKVIVKSGDDPLRPASVSVSGILTYGVNLPIADGTSDLVAYWVAANKVDKVQAEAYSSIYRRPVVSNLIRLRIELPPHLQGAFELGETGLDGATWLV